jgi:hypothetical protein
VTQPIFIPIETKRDCIIQNGQRFCESTEESPADVGFAILGVVVFGAWAIGGVLTHWSGRALAAYYVIPPVLLALGLICYG